MRSSVSAEVMRSISLLLLAWPGAMALDLMSVARVSIETSPLYVPAVWHLAQRAFKRGRISWAKSTDLSAEARSSAQAAAAAQRAARASAKDRINGML